MSYVVTVTKTAVNVPTIPGDQYPDDDPENPNAAANYMLSAYVGVTYIVDLTIRLFQEVAGGEGTSLEPEPITSLSITTPGRSGVTFTPVSSDIYERVVRMSGTLNDAVFNSTYDLVLPALPGTQTFPIATNVPTSGTLPEYLAIIRWTPPTDFSYEYIGAYLVVANAGQSTQASRSMNQYVYWNWESGLAAFQTDLAAGSI